MEDSGYSGCEITAKPDQEPAIIGLRKATGATRTGVTVPINSPVRCSKSNERIENAVKGFKGQPRVLKHFQKQMPVDCALVLEDLAPRELLRAKASAKRGRLA